jgi:hypothetical protein
MDITMDELNDISSIGSFIMFFFFYVHNECNFNLFIDNICIVRLSNKGKSMRTKVKGKV